MEWILYLLIHFTVFEIRTSVFFPLDLKYLRSKFIFTFLVALLFIES